MPELTILEAKVPPSLVCSECGGQKGDRRSKTCRSCWIQTPRERFWAKVDSADVIDGCWEWLGGKTPMGYGVFWQGEELGFCPAHRFAYKERFGVIPEGLELDHLCRNPGCVNPAHLEPVTHRENVLRGEGIPARRVRQTHCVNGHAFTEENTYIYKDGTRRCRACQRMYRQRRAA